MQILALSDVVLDQIYNPRIQQRFAAVDLVISCGDLPYYYLEYVLDKLNKPLFYVRGNHAAAVEFGEHGERHHPHGATDLHRKAINYQGVLMAGIEGSLRYRDGPYQYTQSEMWLYAMELVPTLLINRQRYGRSLDILVTHAPSWGIQDQSDHPHQGLKAFRWLVERFKPRFHCHGHIHVYRPDIITETQVGPTRVLNCYGYREFTI